jgi:cell wall-associated NlpC family hydrolase
VASVAGLLAVTLPGAAASARPAGVPATLQATVNEANALANQVASLDQQYDNLQTEYQQAQAEVAQVADQGYMMGSLSPTIQLLQNPDPQQVLNSSSILLELEHVQGGKVSLLSQAEAAANRAKQTAAQEERQATKLAADMRANLAQAQAKENVLNSKAFAQAMAIYDQTGVYPPVAVTGDSIGAQALRWAMTKLGDPYVYAAAGPNTFDCSGLTMWAYAQVGISLVHYTGTQWTEGVHVSVNQLEPGDLVFFYPDISHVGMYVGDGLMIDAPHTGTVVQIQPIFWDEYVGAVQIVA